MDAVKSDQLYEALIRCRSFIAANAPASPAKSALLGLTDAAIAKAREES